MFYITIWFIRLDVFNKLLYVDIETNMVTICILHLDSCQNFHSDVEVYIKKYVKDLSGA